MSEHVKIMDEQQWLHARIAELEAEVARLKARSEATEQAAKALRLVIESTRMHPQVRADVDSALARLTTEQPPVPPDREKLIARINQAVDDADGQLPLIDLAALFETLLREAAAALRPSPRRPDDE